MPQDNWAENRRRILASKSPPDPRIACPGLAIAVTLKALRSLFRHCCSFWISGISNHEKGQPIFITAQIVVELHYYFRGENTRKNEGANVQPVFNDPSAASESKAGTGQGKKTASSNGPQSHPSWDNVNGDGSQPQRQRNRRKGGKDPAQ